MQNHRFGELERSEGCNQESLESVSRPLQIVVPYTTPDLSRAALNAAATLAEDMQATVVLLAVQVVPYPLPLDQPPVQTTFFLRQLTTMARENPLQVRIELVLARSRSEALRKFIAPGTLVLLVTKKRWWRTPEERLARILAEQGCSVSLLTLRPGRGSESFRSASPTVGEITKEGSHA
jgi:hypothetical protein